MHKGFLNPLQVLYDFFLNDMENLGIDNIIYIDNCQSLNFNIQDGVITNNNSSTYHYTTLLKNLIRKESNNNNDNRKIYPYYSNGIKYITKK